MLLLHPRRVDLQVVLALSLGTAMALVVAADPFPPSLACHTVSQARLMVEMALVAVLFDNLEDLELVVSAPGGIE